ncbi:MAG: hypothetical protein KJ600_03310 [Nanoarchaeota archaeon]|nr:hypothetical protein [Nanoarchaeota archaeon]
MIKNNESIIEKVKEAQEIVKASGIGENLANSAFKVVLEYLIKSEVKLDNLQEEKVQEGSVKKVGNKSLINYLKQAGSKSHADKILMMAYYMLTHENKLLFDRKDIKEEYLKIKEPQSKNLTVEFNSLIKRGFIMLSEDKSHFILTQPGIEEIKRRLQDE